MAAVTSPPLLDARAPFDPSTSEVKKGVPRGDFEVGHDPRREERLHEGRGTGLGPPKPVLPSPSHACAPGSEIQTDTALSRQEIYGPRGTEGGAGSERRGRETA